MPTLAAATVAAICTLTWVTQPRLQGNQALRYVLIASVLATVALGLIAGVDIFARVMAFGLDEAF